MKASAQAAIEAVDGDLVVHLSRETLRMPSLSGEEQEVARFFADAMNDAGIEAATQEVPPSEMMGASLNAIGHYRGSGGGPTVLFNGHLDHNPVCDGWTKDPFGGVIEDGWLYGFVHMKAADATYIAAVDAVKRAGIDLRGSVAIAHVCGELRGGAGTKHALSEGLTADCFILGEPTELSFGFNHAASIVVRLHVRGRMKHFATVETEGQAAVNAVEAMAAVIAGLGPSHTPMRPKDDGGWLGFEPCEGFEGLPQINIGPVRGGISGSYDASRPALFPDLCTLTIDFRIIPGMTKESVEKDLAQHVHAILGDDVAFDIEFAADTFPIPFDSDRDSLVSKVIGEAHKAVRGEKAVESEVLKFAASDAAWMSAAGIPGIIYGPTGKYLSRPDERCEVKDLIDTTRIYAAAIVALCE